MEPQLDLCKKVLSILGYVFVIPYGILEPILKIPSLTVTPDESSYDVHIAAAVFAVVVHALIIFLLFRGVRRRVSFGVALHYRRRRKSLTSSDNVFLRCYFFAAYRLHLVGRRGRGGKILCWGNWSRAKALSLKKQS